MILNFSLKFQAFGRYASLPARTYSKKLKGGACMQAHVNENCIGCGLCTTTCPAVFSMTDEGVAAARNEVPPECEAQAREAAESCPVSAIEVQ